MSCNIGPITGSKPAERARPRWYADITGRELLSVSDTNYYNLTLVATAWPLGTTASPMQTASIIIMRTFVRERG